MVKIGQYQQTVDLPRKAHFAFQQMNPMISMISEYP